jgi:hypothetical protein
MDYGRGLTELKTRLQASHPDRLIEFSMLEARLLENAEKLCRREKA